MDWHLLSDVIGWTGWAVAAWKLWHASAASAPDKSAAPSFQPAPRTASQRAMLLNADGRLDSVRTMTGPPPEQIVCAAGTYIWDRDSVSDHLVYRLTVTS